MANINKIVGNVTSAIGEAYEKHPYLTSEAVGAFNGMIDGAIIGGIAGGIKSDESVLEGAGKGALIGTGIGLAVGIPYNSYIAKSNGTDIRGMGKAFKTAGKFMTGMGYDGIGL